MNGTIEGTLLLFATGEVMSYLVIGRAGRLCWEGQGVGLMVPRLCWEGGGPGG